MCLLHCCLHMCNLLFQYGPVFTFEMAGKKFTYLVGSEASSLLFNSKNEDLNAEDVYSKLVTPVFGKGVAYDVPNDVSGEINLNHIFFIGNSPYGFGIKATKVSTTFIPSSLQTVKVSNGECFITKILSNKRIFNMTSHTSLLLY